MGADRILLVSDDFGREVSVTESALARLRALGPVEHLPESAGVDRVLDALRDRTALVVAGWATRMPRLTAERLDGLPRLSFVGCGQDNRWRFIDPGDALERGITPVDASGSMGWAVAEFGLGLILSCLRRIPAHHAEVAAGGWFDGWADDTGIDRELRGSRVGIVGMGEIGRALATMLRPFGCDVDVWSSYLGEEEAARLGVRPRPVHEIAGSADVLVVATQPRRYTAGIVDRAALEALRPGAVVVLLGRASTVDFGALVERASAGDITVGIDVWDEEPAAPGHPLRGLPNVVHTPHVAGRLRSANQRILGAVVDDLERLRSGGAPRWAVSAQRARRIAAGRR
ncbi:hydroxyacid dehydrogenase [Actinomadura viridis]|uniref:D-3-phosphoglycerate dehydrogenase n=1 Tax=Actinomadura viridis TaxID=58110 RepID=A0A931DKU4_9ACTN|nr:NAD(P)-dependent oxidoreductase [Actinomadura viridis]MBG6093059.1 D-3-phosphoglycerate dehydrogenase [Actinomadura viridis]